MDAGRLLDREVRVRAWCRADLAGGTLDIWPLGLLHPGARTVNVALDLAIEIAMSRRAQTYRMRQGDSVVEARSPADLAATEDGALVGLIAEALDLPPIDLTVASASPRGGGLGASSAIAVAAIAAGEALNGGDESTAEIRATLARDLEARLMSLPTGCQDHYPAQLGGALEIRHEPGGEQVRRIDTDLSALAESLLVVFTGQSHFSAGNNWRIIRSRLEGDPETRRSFDGICKAAAGIVEALRSGQLPRVGELMTEEWRWRRRLAEGISNPTIEDLLNAAGQAGAWGGKACGAGGGGCLAVLGPPTSREAIARSVKNLGGRILDTRPTADPMEVRWVDTRLD